MSRTKMGVEQEEGVNWARWHERGNGERSKTWHERVVIRRRRPEVSRWCRREQGGINKNKSTRLEVKGDKSGRWRTTWKKGEGTLMWEQRCLESRTRARKHGMEDENRRTSERGRVLFMSRNWLLSWSGNRHHSCPLKRSPPRHLYTLPLFCTQIRTTSARHAPKNWWISSVYLSSSAKIIIIISRVMPRISADNKFYSMAFSLNDHQKALCRELNLRYFGSCNHFYSQSILFQ